MSAGNQRCSSGSRSSTYLGRYTSRMSHVKTWLLEAEMQGLRETGDLMTAKGLAGRGNCLLRCGKPS